MKLTTEEQETLLSFKNSDEHKAIMKVVEILVEDQRRDLFSIDLRVASDRELSLAKARSEGAQKLLNELSKFLSKSPKA